jgi:hypothetical protein
MRISHLLPAVLLLLPVALHAQSTDAPTRMPQVTSSSILSEEHHSLGEIGVEASFS